MPSMWAFRLSSPKPAGKLPERSEVPASAAPKPAVAFSSAPRSDGMRERDRVRTARHHGRGIRSRNGRRAASCGGRYRRGGNDGRRPGHRWRPDDAGIRRSPDGSRGGRSDGVRRLGARRQHLHGDFIRRFAIHSTDRTRRRQQQRRGRSSRRLLVERLRELFADFVSRLQHRARPRVLYALGELRVSTLLDPGHLRLIEARSRAKTRGTEYKGSSRPPWAVEVPRVRVAHSSGSCRRLQREVRSPTFCGRRGGCCSWTTIPSCAVRSREPWNTPASP